MTSLHDRLRRDLILTRFCWAIQNHPDARRLTRELRRELASTADEVGLRQALDDLGSPKDLARGYLTELDRPVPQWTTGTIWGAITLAFALYTGLAYAFGTLDTLSELAGAGSLSVQRGVLGATFDYTGGAHELTMTASLSWGWFALHALIFALPFVLGARIWRLWSTRR